MLEINCIRSHHVEDISKLSDFINFEKYKKVFCKKTFFLLKNKTIGWSRREKKDFFGKPNFKFYSSGKKVSPFDSYDDWGYFKEFFIDWNEKKIKDKKIYFHIDEVYNYSCSYRALNQQGFWYVKCFEFKPNKI